MTCEFSNPVNYLGQEPLEGEDWEFKNLTCTQEYLEYNENLSTGADFYLDQRLSYGDIFLMVITSVVLLYVVIREIATFVFRKE